MVTRHGDEGKLSAAFAAEMQKLPNARYFLVDAEGKILSEQKGIIRSNCIDCLDRTNVTQSYLAEKSLNSQLQRLGALPSTECISMSSEDFEIFRTLWVEQGDDISLEYSGTHALKQDLVRYGKQTMAGLIKDGISAISRYYLNNFQDGVRQDAMDLMSGRYSVNRNNPSPFQLNGFESFSYLPVASALLIGGLTATSVTLNRAGRNAQYFMSSVICAGVATGMMALVKANGRQFCSRPRLCGLLVLSHYQEYYEEKSLAANRDVFLVFFPTWFTPLERAFFWIAGFKPGLEFRLVAASVDNMWEDQSQRMRQLMSETKAEERELGNRLARAQESVIEPPVLGAARREMGLRDGEVGEGKAVIGALRSAMEAVLGGADSLRTRTAERVVEILSAAQNVRFLAAATQLQMKIRMWGLEREAERGRQTRNEW
ncbi:SAC domain-containing protein 8 [Actinidia rufa]|uniref:SAC domain-containing protein 8 n=1 Tax=Actinidia rufa TaxID=165716 RepID=A0A7J0E7A8_9ERIC|nr:SAC domain-containing protein 8 [Actinidia rufa]